MSDSAWHLFTQAVHCLAAAVSRLARAIESQARSRAHSDLASVEAESIEAGIDPLHPSSVEAGPDQSPPSSIASVDPSEVASPSALPVDQRRVPYHLVEQCRLYLSQRHPGPEVRASEAYRAGIRAALAIESDSAYQPRVPFAGSKARHWVVLRSTLFDSFRTSKASGLDRIGIVRTDQLLILESFDSLAEVTVFCAGAQRRIPDLRHE